MTEIYRFRVWKKNDRIFCDDDIYTLPQEKFEQQALDQFLTTLEKTDIVKILNAEDNMIIFFSLEAKPITEEWRSIQKGIDLIQNFDAQFIIPETN